MDIASIRKQYSKATLDEHSLAANPFVQFKTWFEQALDCQLDEPTAMHLATVEPNGRPSGRIVLLKGFSEEGFVFFSNYLSRKGLALEKNPHASLTFFWSELERQVRIEGTVTQTTAQASEQYFKSRPVESQIGAIISPQSQKISKQTLLDTYQLYQEKPALIQRPMHWGGFVLQPDYFEFWQGRPGRLHDRLVFDKIETKDWQTYRLAP